MTQKMNGWMGVSVFLISMNAFSGQSGYMLNGKEVITHIDGKEVASVSNAESSKDPKSKRNPANTKVNGLVQFDEDTFARCYWLPNMPALQCIKK